MELHPKIRKCLPNAAEDSDEEVISNWKARLEGLDKPCWHLGYCPYGSLVEDFPVLPMTALEEREHMAALETMLNAGLLADGTPLDAERRELFSKWLAEAVPEEQPETIPPSLVAARCTGFGHLCPVYFVAEGDAECPDQSPPRGMTASDKRMD